MRVCQRGISGVLVLALLLGLAAGFVLPQQMTVSAETEYFVDSLENLGKTFDSSKGWSIKDDANTPFDPTRIYRQADVPEYITYKTDKPITGYMVKVYSMQLGQNLKIETSVDGANWEQAYFVADSVEGGVTDGWSWTYLVQEDALPDNTCYFKVIAQNDAKIWQPQISEVELYFDGATTRPVKFEEEKEEEDLIVKSDYREELEFLYSLGIYQDRFAENPQLSKPFTRAQLADVLVRMSRLEQAAQKQTSTSFKDTAGREDAGSIQMAVDLGYLKGYADQTFDPDGAVTFAVAFESMVKLLGYDKIWPEFPAAQIAARIGLTSGLSYDSASVINKEQMAKLVWQALDTVPVMQEPGKEVYYKSERTLLEENYSLKKYKGVVTATKFGTVYGASDLKENEVGIDGLICQARDSRIQEYLGYGITYYTQENSDDRRISHFSVDLSKNKPVTVPARDVCYEDSRFTTQNFVYTNDADRVIEKGINLQYFVKNGERKLFETKEDLKISDGSVTILDSDGNGGYDTMLAENYLYIVPWNIDADNQILTETFGTARYDFSQQKQDGNLHIFQNRKEIQFSDLKAGMTLAVASSENGERVKIYASETKMSVSASMIKEDEITLQDHVYHMTQWYRDHCDGAEAAGGMAKIELGKQQKFYLDHEMNIAAVENITAKKEYAYLTGAAELPMDGGLKVRMFTSRGEWVELTSAKSTVLVDDGANLKKCDPEEVVRRLADSRKSLGQTDGKLGQVVRYRTNGEGALVELDIAKHGKDPDAFSLDADDKNAGTNGSNIMVTSRKEGTATISDAFSFGTKTAIFAVPEDENAEEEFSISYTLAEGNVNTNSSVGKYHLQVYDSDEMNAAAAMVIYKNDRTTTYAETSTNFSMVKELNQVYDPETLETVYQLTYISKKAEYSTIVDEGVTFSKAPATIRKITDVKPGDVILVQLNGDGKINNIRYVYRLESNEFTIGSTPTVGFVSDTALSNDFLLMHGYIKNMKSPFMLMQGKNRTFVGSISSPNIAIYDEGLKEKVRVGTADEIQKGDEIVFRSYRFQMSDVMIYRGVPEKDEDGNIRSN